MSYFIITLLVVVLLGFFLIYFWVKKNWRAQAIIFAAVYSNYKDTYDQKTAFLKTLEFRYKPPKVNSRISSEPTNFRELTKHRRRLIARYLGILIIKGFDDIVDDYIREFRAVDLFHPDLGKVKIKLVNPPFEYVQNEYTLIELLYCFLVIEHPSMVKDSPRKGIDELISNLLEINQNRVRATTLDSKLINDMESVEKL